MVSYEVVSGVASAALILGWLYYQEYQRHKKTDELARDATSFYVSKVPKHEPSAPVLWMYECCNTFVLFNQVRQHGSEFYLMEDEVIKARLTIPQHQVDAVINCFDDSGCPVKTFDPNEFQ